MILDHFRLDGQVAIVTGASRGLGAAAAVALAEAGADVLIAARTAETLGAVAASVQKLGRRAIAVTADLSDLTAVSQLAETAMAQLGRIDIVVNNVGGTLPNTFLTTSPEFLEEAFHFNVSTAHALTQAAVPHMLAGGGGAVVNISSMMGRSPGRGFLAYGTAKAGLAHWTRLAATDLAPRIRVNAIAVGSVLTSALEVVAAQPEIKAKMEAMTPLHRLGQPWEVAAGILYLASPAGAYLTGKVLEIDGGTTHPNLEIVLPDL